MIHIPKRLNNPVKIFVLSTGMVLFFQNCFPSALRTMDGEGDLSSEPVVDLVSGESPVSSQSSQETSQGSSQSSQAALKLGRMGVQQFGYWGSAFDAVNGDATGEYIDELSASSNVVFVSGIDPVSKDVSHDRIIHKIQKAQKAGLGVVLNVQSFYFEWGSVRLLSDGKTRFRSLWAKLGPLQSAVKSFYVYDEPFGWNAVASADKQIHNSFVRDHLNAVASDLKELAPLIPSVAVFGPVEIDYPNFYSELMPKQVSWVGFDCYRMEEVHSRCTESDVRRHFKAFAAVAAKNGQALVLVPDAFSFVSPSEEDQLKTVARLKLYKELSASSWAVRAIYPWLYQDHTDADGKVLYWGARSLPHVKNELQIFFDVLMDRAHCDSNLDLVYKNGAKWAKAPACAVTCEGGEWTSRDADGAFYSRGGSCQ